jgi:hypothetical protein
MIPWDLAVRGGGSEIRLRENRAGRAEHSFDIPEKDYHRICVESSTLFIIIRMRREVVEDMGR